MDPRDERVLGTINLLASPDEFLKKSEEALAIFLTAKPEEKAPAAIN